MANPEHLDLLRQGVDVWNAWRAKESSVRADLSEANLSEANLSGATMIPLQPIIEASETPFAMLEDLRWRYDWVLKTQSYLSLDQLIETMDDKIIKPAEAKFKQLLARRAEPD